ncbi:MAG: sensor histidine kinase [Rubrivivax sp.]
MFRRRLSLVLTLLALAVVVEGLAAAAALRVASRQVERGRVASDIQLGFVELSAGKQRLRTWVAQLQQGAGADPAVRDQIERDMNATLQKLQGLTAQALALGDAADGDPAAQALHLQRQDALTVLQGSLAELKATVAQVQPLQEGTDAREAWQALSAVFDRSQGRDLRQLLALSMQRETEAVQRERAAADATLAWMRALWLVMAGTLAAAALGASLYFARALKRPLDRLLEGTQALQAGRLEHRIELQGSDEFSRVARQMNTLAADLADHRQAETRQRLELERLVQARTAALQEALDALQRADGRRRQLLADISHELRTPTTAIRGEAEITLRGPARPADEYRSALHRIVDTSRDLGHVIDDLLAVARQDLDALSLVRRPIDLAPVLTEALAQAGALAARHGVTVQCDALPASPWPLRGDAQRLRQLLLTLMDNAIVYSPAGQTVRVGVHRLPAAAPAADRSATSGATQWLQIEVSDSGLGIAPEDLPRVFERHFRGAAARQHRPEGHGLGLAIARTLAQAHGGDLALRSTPGEGTQAVLTLPLDDAADPVSDSRPGGGLSAGEGTAR